MLKKFCLLAFAVIIAFGGLTMTDSNAEYVCGDANSDAALNVSDAVFIINYVFIGGPAPDPGCCDNDCPPTVMDIDGNTYFAVKIGDQCWTAQNLKVTHYQNGDSIPNVTDAVTWEGLSTGAYCDYDNDEDLVAVHGRLYNWYAVDDSRGIAPVGWHVPSDAEWKELEIYLGMTQAEADAEGLRGTDEGGKLKESGPIYWLAPNLGATNESGFTALPSGTRNYDGPFNNFGANATFWTSTEFVGYSAWQRTILYDNSQILRAGSGAPAKRYGFSIRCVKDQ